MSSSVTLEEYLIPASESSDSRSRSEVVSWSRSENFFLTTSPFSDTVAVGAVPPGVSDVKESACTGSGVAMLPFLFAEPLYNCIVIAYTDTGVGFVMRGVVGALAPPGIRSSSFYAKWVVL